MEINKKYLLNIDDYEFIKVIDKGGFGKISLAREKTTNKLFAIKENLFIGTNNSLEEVDVENEKSFREILILMNVRHETIIGLKGFSYKNFQHDNSITIIMEYKKKGSLKTLLDNEKKKRIDEDYDNTRRQIILIGIAKGMALLHSKKIFHRDLKPGNVLLNSDLEPKITDFGLSKYFDPQNSLNLTQSQYKCGTPFYMAPEVINSCHYDNKADVYSFGIMIYEIITSSIPFSGCNIDKMSLSAFQSYVINGNRPMFNDRLNISQEFKDLINRCWDGEPNNRPTFLEIYQTLSENINYFLPNVDKDKIKNYIEKIDPKPYLYWHNIEDTSCFTENGQTMIDHENIHKGFINSTKQPVMIKHLKYNGEIDKNYEILKKEAQYMIHYSHFAIQNIFGFCSPENNKGDTVLITPFRENYSLDHFIDKDFNKYEPNEQTEKLNFSMKFLEICGICNAMMYLEQRKQPHGNLNPSNILIDKDFYPYIKGIGMLQKYSREEMEDETKTYINYFSPEIIKGEDYSIKSDVYSFGLIVNQMFSYEIPYHGIVHNSEIIDKIERKEKPEISEKIPGCLLPIVKNCLSDDKNERKSFAEITAILYSSIFGLTVDKIKIHAYISMIQIQEQISDSFFRPLISIVAPPSEITDLGNDESPIRFDILENILLPMKQQNRPIHLIMVFGTFEVGKSTFLRSLTGNNAFYSGTGQKSTTQGILIDGPYSSDELIRRIQSDSIKQECLKDDIRPKDNPAIFFLDSQGTGDEAYEKYYLQIMERVHSIFCTVSDICINISNINETVTIMSKTLTTIRRGQMAMNSSEIAKIFFLVKSVPNDIQSLFSEENREGFVKATKIFQPIWEKEHKIVSERYNKDLIKVFPLGDLKSASIYFCSVWNVLIDIFSNFRKETSANEIIDRARFCSMALFSSFFAQINENNENETNLPEILKKSSKTEKDIFYLSCYAQFYIKSSLEYCMQKRIESNETAKGIELTLKIISEVVAPYILGGNDISYGDYFQFSYEIKRDFASFLKTSYTDWSTMGKKYFKFGIRDIIGIGGCAALIILSVIPTPASPIALGLYISSTFALEGSSLFLLGDMIITKKKTKEIFNKAVPMTVPFLWERNITEKGLQIIKFTDINKLVKKADLHKNKLILALEQPECDLSFILQSMTGIKCEFSNEGQIVAKFGPIAGSELIKRIQRVQSPLKSDISNSKVTILYLRGYKKEDISKIPFQEHIFNMFTAVKFGQELNIFPCSPIRFWVFTLVPELSMFYYFGRKQITSIIPLITKECPELNNPKLWFRFPIIGNNFKFTQCGPRTNSTLRFAFRAIYSEEKIIKEIINPKI